jgi:hypothetical protein
MRAAGKAGALMAGRAVRETVTLAGRADRARLARVFVEGLQAPVTQAGTWLRCWWASFSLIACGTAARVRPGETVAVKTLYGVIRVEVTDRSGQGCRNRNLLAATRRTAGGFISLPALQCGGDGEGAAGGQ